MKFINNIIRIVSNNTHIITKSIDIIVNNAPIYHFLFLVIVFSILILLDLKIIKLPVKLTKFYNTRTLGLILLVCAIEIPLFYNFHWDLLPPLIAAFIYLIAHYIYNIYKCTLHINYSFFDRAFGQPHVRISIYTMMIIVPEKHPVLYVALIIVSLGLISDCRPITEKVISGSIIIIILIFIYKGLVIVFLVYNPQYMVCDMFPNRRLPPPQPPGPPPAWLPAPQPPRLPSPTLAHPPRYPTPTLAHPPRLPSPRLSQPPMFTNRALPWPPIVFGAHAAPNNPPFRYPGPHTTILLEFGRLRGFPADAPETTTFIRNPSYVFDPNNYLEAMTELAQSFEYQKNNFRNNYYLSRAHFFCDYSYEAFCVWVDLIERLHPGIFVNSPRFSDGTIDVRKIPNYQEVWDNMRREHDFRVVWDNMRREHNFRGVNFNFRDFNNRE